VVTLVSPQSGLPLQEVGNELIDGKGGSFPIVAGIPRICDPDNYTQNFGMQWNKFDVTQIDRPETGLELSTNRFFAETGWTPEDLADQDVLEVGSGAGRFTQVVLANTKARLWSVDYSSAVEANLRNNAAIAPDRLKLFQSSIYEMPFPDGSFDKVFCLGVLQHTPDFEASVRALVAKAKPGGEIVVDFYPIRGWWTKLNAKYQTTAMYHTHSGVGLVGAPIWDLHIIMKDIDPKLVGVNYDIGHATIEGGLGGWIASWRVTGAHVRGVAVKDFVWAKDGEVIVQITGMGP